MSGEGVGVTRFDPAEMEARKRPRKYFLAGKYSCRLLFFVPTWDAYSVRLRDDKNRICGFGVKIILRDTNCSETVPRLGRFEPLAVNIVSESSNASALAYQLAWIGVAVVFVYYTLATIALHWNSRRNIGVTRYEPPDGISPGVAGYLLENGRSERAFAAALISLATKGFLEIQQQDDWFVLEKLREPDESLPSEESAILAALFSPPSVHTYKFNGREYDWICRAYETFEETVAGVAEPQLISRHRWIWVCGVFLSFANIAQALFSLPILDSGAKLKSIAYLGIWIAMGGSSLVASLRIWPATIRKLLSFMPGSNRPTRPLDLNDAIPFILLAPILLGFSFLVYLTSLQFARLVIALVVLNYVFRHTLEAPTKAGRRVIGELKNFREFLSRADADRLNRENKPGQTPEVLEKYSAYAVALDIERGWGEEFTENLLELLQFDQAYTVRSPKVSFPDFDDSTIELKINPRK